MKKQPLYSRSGRPARPAGAGSVTPPVGPSAAAPAGSSSAAEAAGAEPTHRAAAGTATAIAASAGEGRAAAAPARRGRFRSALRRHERWLWASFALVLALAAGWPAWRLREVTPMTMQQVDRALRESLVKEPLPSKAARAAEAVRPSVVRVVAYQHGAKTADAGSDRAGRTGPKTGKEGKEGKDGKDGKSAKPAAPPPHSEATEDTDDDDDRSIGTGVVIIDDGTILTNLHVVQGAQRIEVTFFDGHKSDAVVVTVQPENDLAVLRARSIPDDLQAATMRSTADLAAGDEVVAVGFPFGIGPSVSSGVVSGLKRDFRSPEGKRVLSNLIQFDAAANPGNSGGPLVTMDGNVVGIVTAIMNPTEQATFIGIGFAMPIENAAAAAGLPPF